ncbi:MAG: methylenetetrahydrofolate reductase [Xanthomonadales bacterium]|jgi:methylenetetrahydrofolate reductase (NADPH)|nr:methylenetetrahydrofolate reductase [Xanthomonadales bacterium]
MLNPRAQGETATAAIPEQTAARTLLAHSSIELTTNGREAIEAAARHLPAGTRVYVPKMPRQTLEDKLVQISLLHHLGLEPVPHIVARQLASRMELRDFLARAADEAGVRRVLVIGGDQQQEAGPFPASAVVIASGLLQEAGITHVDVAGYPDGHPEIPQETLQADLELKLRLADEQNLRLGIVTQFSFAPAGIADYCSAIAQRAPNVPVYAGIPGPTNPKQLLRYARICGVSTSIKAVNLLGLNAVKLALHSSPDRQLGTLADCKSRSTAGQLSGVHLFSFGGFVESAEWLARSLRQAESQTR